MFIANFIGWQFEKGMQTKLQQIKRMPNTRGTIFSLPLWEPAAKVDKNGGDKSPADAPPHKNRRLRTAGEFPQGFCLFNGFGHGGM